MTPLPSIVPGANVDDRFTLIRHLGRGSMGTVWLARHLSLNIEVAVKFMDRALAQEPGFLERFEREARAAASINSPNVVRILDYGQDRNGQPYMVMEYLEGNTLEQLLSNSPKLGLAITARIVTDTCRGLGRAHAAGVVHRDLKPENLFLCEDGDNNCLTKILDFGIAKAGLRSAHATNAGQLVGSPLFMSPEQARGERSVDYRSDLFSLGVVAYLCLTGVHPFAGDTLFEVFAAINSQTPKAPHQVNPKLSPALAPWFARALAKKPAERFPSAKEMGQAFANIAGFDTASGVDLTIPQKPTNSAAHASVARDTVVTTGETLTTAEFDEALVRISRIPHVDGVGIVGADGRDCLARGRRSKQELCTVAARLHGAVGALESLGDSGAPSQFIARFEQGAIYTRWLGGLTLVVIGDAAMRSLLVSVGTQSLATKLESLQSSLDGGQERMKRLFGTLPSAPAQAVASPPLPSRDAPSSNSARETASVITATPQGPMQPAKPAMRRYRGVAIEEAEQKETASVTATQVSPTQPAPTAAPVKAAPLPAVPAVAPQEAPRKPARYYRGVLVEE